MQRKSTPQMYVRVVYKKGSPRHFSSQKTPLWINMKSEPKHEAQAIENNQNNLSKISEAMHTRTVSTMRTVRSNLVQKYNFRTKVSSSQN